MNLTKVRFQAALEIKHFFYHVHKYPITFERIYNELNTKFQDLSPSSSETMNEYFNAVFDDYKKMGTDEQHENIKTELKQAHEALKPGYPFTYGTSDITSVNMTIKHRCFWEYYKQFYETLKGNPDKELSDIFLLDKCVFILNKFKGHPPTEQDTFNADEDSRLIEIAQSEGLQVFTNVCCEDTVTLIESTKYHEPEFADVKILNTHCLNTILKDPMNLDDFKKSIDRLFEVSEKLSNDQVKQLFIDTGMYKLKQRTIDYAHYLTIPAYKLVNEYYLSKLPTTKQKNKTPGVNFSALQWATIFYYADETKLLPNGRTKIARIQSFMTKHEIATTPNNMKSKYYKATNKINKTSDYPTKKLEEIIPFLNEHYPKTVTKIKNDIDFLKDNDTDY